MRQRMTRIALSILFIVALLATGCRQKAVVATPEKARDTLRQGLDAWKSGQTPDAIQASAAITFADEHWKNGEKLLAYEVQGDGQSDGFDWQCKVKLSIEDAQGKKSEKRAVYNISTAPKLVVVRMEF